MFRWFKTVRMFFLLVVLTSYLAGCERAPQKPSGAGSTEPAAKTPARPAADSQQPAAADRAQPPVADSAQLPGAGSAGPPAAENAQLPPAGTGQLPGNLFLGAAPAEAKDVAEVKSAAKQGDEVVVRGRIGGRRDPFVEGRASFILAEASIPTCAEHGNTGCPTPWDYCCEPKDKLVAGTMTVQVVGADGKPLKLGLNGVSGLKPAAKVVIKGRISQKQEGQVLVVDATGIFVDKS